MLVYQLWIDCSRHLIFASFDAIEERRAFSQWAYYISCQEIYSSYVKDSNKDPLIAVVVQHIQQNHWKTERAPQNPPKVFFFHSVNEKHYKFGSFETHHKDVGRISLLSS